MLNWHQDWQLAIYLRSIQSGLISEILILLNYKLQGERIPIQVVQNKLLLEII